MHKTVLHGRARTATPFSYTSAATLGGHWKTGH
jgi:hypothetical protein